MRSSAIRSVTKTCDERTLSPFDRLGRKHDLYRCDEMDISLAAGDPDARLAGPELIVRLALARGLTKEELDAILARLAKRWAASDVIATRVDSLKVQLVAHD